MLKGKIHRAMITESDLNYVGSITIDAELMEEAGIFENEKVQVVDINNGNRFETYVITGERKSGMICVNGAASRCVQKGDKIIIMAYCEVDSVEIKEHKPKIVFVDEYNNVIDITNKEIHGEIR